MGVPPTGSGCQPTASAATASSLSGIPNAAHLEFRPDHKGEFDELVARFADGSLFVEMMNDDAVFIDIQWDDGRYCHWWLSSKKRLKSTFEHGTDDPPRYTAQGVDTKPHLPDYGALAARAIEARRAIDSEAGVVEDESAVTK